jgi:hypothetical protein
MDLEKSEGKKRLPTGTGKQDTVAPHPLIDDTSEIAELLTFFCGITATRFASGLDDVNELVLEQRAMRSFSPSVFAMKESLFDTIGSTRSRRTSRSHISDTPEEAVATPLPERSKSSGWCRNRSPGRRSQTPPINCWDDDIGITI